MKITCLNAWGGARFAELRSYLNHSAPDVLCLQEVVHTPSTDREVLTYRDGEHVLPQRANLFREIAHALPDHVATFCPAAQGVLWEGERAVPSQWGLATFVRHAFPVVAQHQGFVHKVYSPDGYGEHPRSRSAHAVRVFDHEQGRAVVVAHMHGLRDLRGKMDTPERAAQARRFLAIVRHVAQPDDLVVAGGGFQCATGQ
ncbi:hypothetical protein LZG03_00075 [Opitutaceae bacterium LMO-CP1]|uniref:Endonuclease/exonuclease/phosphatase domain-containing protein n=1 Tax=Synoicihabitans lomoniglobus TaxID=2909285 RepID=A0AAE9ZQD7_9BACT|nr:hypothetical protein [Opitutaceae bacterium LMO-M01]WED63135.1 hypothetical protein PXH66_12420 [Opitutaceae bacterium LMO-M01]